jgi:hypothetical protein
MEQDFSVYEYRMCGEAFRFEAEGDLAARKTREIALLDLRDRLGDRYSEAALEGPFKIEFSEFVVRETA